MTLANCVKALERAKTRSSAPPAGFVSFERQANFIFESEPFRERVLHSWYAGRNQVAVYGPFGNPPLIPACLSDFESVS